MVSAGAAGTHEPPDDDEGTRIASREGGDDDRTRIAPHRDAASLADAADERTRLVRPSDDATRLAPRLQRGPVQVAGPLAPGEHRAANTVSDASPLDGGTLPGASVAVDQDAAAKQIGRYEVHEKLGRGGMASVFRAHDPGIGRDVAIKFLHSTLCADDEYRRRFLREARAAGGLSHPNIVTVFDVGEIDGRPYMAMELLKGRVLADAMEGGKPLPVRDVVVMGIQLARALDYAHTRGVVHRDIKPGNIAILEGTNTVKVMDFGIAHMDSGGADEHTRVGDVLGTPQYMSPEQTRGEKLDGRSDLFSAGIVLYQMLSGQRPFAGGSMLAVAMKIAQEQPSPLDKLRPEIPAALRRIVERCLAKAPAERFQSGRELSDALGRVLAQLDETAQNETRKGMIPLRVKWAAIMGLVVATVMTLVASVITQREYAAMVEQVSDNGAAMARFIAAQNAEDAVYGEDRWPAVTVKLQNMMSTGDFQRITIVDPNGIVRASGGNEAVDVPYRAPENERVERRADGIEVVRATVGGQAILGFKAPIKFQNVEYGAVLVDLSERPLQRVARLSITLMAVLVVVTVAGVAIAMYFVADWFARPIRTAIEAMNEVVRGNLGHRIGEARKDEFGLLFAAFDRMAQSLQERRQAPPLPVEAVAPPVPPAPDAQPVGPAQVVEPDA